jgi:exosortase/archaeosortase family protein
MLKKVVNKLSGSTRKEITRFFISFIIAWGTSVLLNDIPFVISVIQNTGIEEAFLRFTIHSTGGFLKLLGFPTILSGNIIKIDGTAGVEIIYGCLGIRHLALFAAFIIVQYGTAKNKLWYIPLGCFILLIANILRISSVAITQYYKPNIIDLVHNQAGVFFIYLVILALWLTWVYKYGHYIPKAILD